MGATYRPSVSIAIYRWISAWLVSLAIYVSISFLEIYPGSTTTASQELALVPSYQARKPKAITFKKTNKKFVIASIPPKHRGI